METTSGLNPAEYNPRKITEEDLQRLRKQLKELGDLGGITFNVRTGRLVGGHQRISALEGSWPIKKEAHTDDAGTVAVGFIETPFGRFAYREVDWDEPREKLANLAANNSAGDFDKNKLKDLVLELDAFDLNLDLSGFDKSELDKMLEKIDPPDVQEWDLSDIAEPFWIVIRGPIGRFQQIRDLLKPIENSETIVEASL